MSPTKQEIEKIKFWEQGAREAIAAALSRNKKNIVVLCYYATYEKQFGALLPILSQKHHVVVIPCYKESTLIGAGNEYVRDIHWRLLCSDGSYYYPQLDIAGIDLILSADEVCYENGRIDREFLSKSAKRIYFPHSLLEPTGVHCPADYYVVPSTLVYRQLCENAKRTSKAELLQIGYPKLDESIARYAYQSQNMIAYCPTLHSDKENLGDLNAIIGFDANCIEWLLANTRYTILVRTHPLVFTAQQRTFTLLQFKFAQNPRVVFDTSMGSDFYDKIDFMVTDASTTGFSFAFSTLRPCFFFMPRSTGGAIAENAHRIGGVARNFTELGALIARAGQDDFAPRMRAFRDEVVYHVGNSAQILADKIDAILG
ncbi:MAG: hypothetical protein HDT11_01730 [Helicobacter sp.]|nr:hypothetical protein [Helicobacter sp.]